MPQLILSLDPDGPVVDALAALCDADAQGLSRANLPVPTPLPIRAVLDTGSGLTCIDVRVLQSLALQPSGRQLIQTASGGSAFDCDLYDVRLCIVHPLASPMFVCDFGNVAVADADLLAMPCPALIGCDLLNRVVFVYDGPNRRFSVTY
jgi:hypothetical protein